MSDNVSRTLLTCDGEHLEAESGWDAGARLGHSWECGGDSRSCPLSPYLIGARGGVLSYAIGELFTTATLQFEQPRS
jgi:hypothetical protein